MPRMLFGTHLANTTPYETARTMAKRADTQRWHSLWTYDHLINPFPAVMPLLAQARGESEDQPCLEGWTFLAGLAAETERVHLGCLVSAVTFRYPIVLAKMAATVDIIAKGRLTLGLGAAWHEREHVAFGVPFHTVKERQDRMEETALLLRKMFRSTGRLSHRGQFYSLEDAPFEPKGFGAQGPPVMIGGSGEKRTLRTAAMYGDVINVGGTPADIKRKIQVLEQHCQAAGRDAAEIRKTAGMMAFLTDNDAATAKYRAALSNYLPPEFLRTMPIGNAQQVIDALTPFVDLGLDEIIFIVPDATPAMFERLDREVLSAFD